MSPMTLLGLDAHALPPLAAVPSGASRSAAVAHPHRWLPIAASSVGVMSLAVASGVLAVAHRFIDELSRPHRELDDAQLAQLGGDWSLPRPLPEPPAALQRALSFAAPKGPLLHGEFWAQPCPAPTIVICHGYRTPSVRLRPIAALEYSHGFNVLLFDFRGHGESAAAATTGGNAEVRDLQAALDVAVRQPEALPGQIILHGFSMGAAIALLTPPHPDVAAIIADSPYARLDDILRTLVVWQLSAESTGWLPPLRVLVRLVPALAWSAVTVSRPLFHLRFGHALIGRPDSVFKRGRGRHRNAAPPAPCPAILLIHAVGDRFIPIAHARRIAAAAQACNVPLETYFVEADGHCGAYAHDPDAYVAAVMRFVGQHTAGPHLLPDTAA